MNNNKVHILLIDDDENYLSVVRHRLSTAKDVRFEVLWEKDGKHAIAALKKNSSIDLILMDYYLQNETGIDITKKILDEKIQTPIVFLTSNKDLGSAVHAMKLGAFDYLVKEEINDTILPRTILSTLERMRFRNDAALSEKEKLLSNQKIQAVQELVVTVCHEFNNPLAAIKITTAILGRKQLSEEEKNLLVGLNHNIAILEQHIKKFRDLNFDPLSDLI